MLCAVVADSVEPLDNSLVSLSSMATLQLSFYFVYSSICSGVALILRVFIDM